jgi:hypothetical protein
VGVVLMGVGVVLGGVVGTEWRRPGNGIVTVLVGNVTVIVGVVSVTIGVVEVTTGVVSVTPPPGEVVVSAGPVVSVLGDVSVVAVETVSVTAVVTAVATAPATADPAQTPMTSNEIKAIGNRAPRRFMKRILPCRPTALSRFDHFSPDFAWEQGRV